MTSDDIFDGLGFTAGELEGGSLSVRSPIDGAEIARIRETPAAEMPAIVERSHQAFLAWRDVPAPRRGELVRLLGEVFENARVLSQDYDATGSILTVRGLPGAIARLRRALAAS